MKFEILMERQGVHYRVEVIRTTVNDSFEEFEVKGGEKFILFRCYRPQWKRDGKKGRMLWQIVSMNFTVRGNRKKAAEYIAELQDRIEDILEPKPSFQEMRNKRPPAESL